MKEDLQAVEQQLLSAKAKPSKKFQQELLGKLQSQFYKTSNSNETSQPTTNSFISWVKIHQIAASFLIFFFTLTAGVMANPDTRNALTDWYSPKGSLEIITQPVDIEVSISINAKQQGQAPIVVDRIEPGVHIIKVSRDGYKDFFQEVEIEAQKKSKVIITLGQLEAYEQEHQTYQIELKPLDSIEPQDFLQEYYELINQERYLQAYDLSPQEISYEAFVNKHQDRNYQVFDISLIDDLQVTYKLVDNTGQEVWLQSTLEVTSVGYRLASIVEHQGMPADSP